MISEASRQSVQHVVTGGFSALAGSFIQESLSHMIPWLIVSCAVILCDLLFGIRKCMLLGEKIRFSKALRNTMGKMVTYFAFVCMVCMVNVAAGNQWQIEKFACLLVCFIEFCSIISNILKPKGYSLDVKEVFKLFVGKAADISKTELDEIIKEEDMKNKEQ